MASLVTLQSLLTDAQSKLDSLVTTTRDAPAHQQLSAPSYIRQPEPLEPPYDPVAEAEAIVAQDLALAQAKQQREQELIAVGAAGVAAGVVCTLVLRLLSK